MCENNEIGGQDRINILIVEDHPLVRYGLKATLAEADPNFAVAGAVASVADAKAFLDAHSELHLVLLDILLPDGNGVEVLHHIRQRSLDVKAIAISSISDVETIVGLVQAGLKGFVNKESEAEVLMEAIHTVMSGFEYFGKQITQFIKDVELAANIKKVLTPREIEIVRLAVGGFTAKQMADALCVSNRTIETHKSHIFEKLGIGTTAEMVRYAFEHNLVRL